MSKPAISIVLAIAINTFKPKIPGQLVQIAFAAAMALNWLMLRLMLRAALRSEDGPEFTVKELDAFHEKG
jgi:hypothetical protein